jgi:cobalt/nickel transport protein
VGLITPGVAYGEWVPEQGFEILPGAGYLPEGLDRLSRLWKAPLQFYQFPWVGQTASVSQQAPGYIVSALLGVLIVVGVTWLLGRWLARRENAAPEPPQAKVGQ